VDRLDAWVYQTARNTVADHYRKTGVATQPLEIEPAQGPKEPPAALHPTAAKWLQELVRQLPDKYRDAVELSELDGFSLRVVADRLRLSVSGVKSRVQRGRAMLRDSLDQCCRFEFDRRGNLMDCEPKPDRTICRDCDP